VLARRLPRQLQSLGIKAGLPACLLIPKAKPNKEQPSPITNPSPTLIISIRIQAAALQVALTLELFKEKNGD